MNNNPTFNTQKILDEIINGKSDILVPIFNGLAYIDVSTTENKNCLVHLGDSYYTQTKLTKAKEIINRISLEKAKNDTEVNKLADDTVEIRENILCHESQKVEKQENKEDENKKEFMKKIKEENKKIMEKINKIRKEQNQKEKIKKLKMKSKEEIVNIVLEKLK